MELFGNVIFIVQVISLFCDDLSKNILADKVSSGIRHWNVIQIFSHFLAFFESKVKEFHHLSRISLFFRILVHQNE